MAPAAGQWFPTPALLLPAVRFLRAAEAHVKTGFCMQTASQPIICKKVLIIMLVGVAHIVDLHVVGTGNALRGAVVCFYLSNEGVSLLENAAHLGLPIPEKMKSILAQLHNRIDDTTTDQGSGA